MRKQLFTLVLCAGIALPLFASTGTTATTRPVETVGGFAVKLATAIGTPASSQEIAMQTLQAAGVSFKSDLSARLTSEHAARILSDLGMKVVAPVNPNDEVSVRLSSQLAASAGLSLSAGPGISNDDLPIICLLEKNHGQCTNCCKDALADQPDLTDGKTSRFCSRFCKRPPPTSDPEPEP